MRPQSMAQTVAELEKEGFVDRHADPVDRRQIMVELTKRGRHLLEDERRRRADWLSQAIAEELTTSEQQALVRAIGLLRRIAEL